MEYMSVVEQGNTKENKQGTVQRKADGNEKNPLQYIHKLQNTIGNRATAKVLQAKSDPTQQDKKDKSAGSGLHLLDEKLKLDMPQSARTLDLMPRNEYNPLNDVLRQKYNPTAELAVEIQSRSFFEAVGYIAERSFKNCRKKVEALQKDDRGSQIPPLPTRLEEGKAEKYSPLQAVGKFGEVFWQQCVDDEVKNYLEGEGKRYVEKNPGIVVALGMVAAEMLDVLVITGVVTPDDVRKKAMSLLDGKGIDLGKFRLGIKGMGGTLGYSTDLFGTPVKFEAGVGTDGKGTTVSAGISFPFSTP